MSKELAYGDQVYIQFNSSDLGLAKSNFLICSNAFFDESLIAVESLNYPKTAFMNCVFTLLPCLVDTRDETELLNHLENELELLPSELSQAKQNTHLGYSTLKKNILQKKKSLQKREATLGLINQKIISESIGKTIRFGESVLFQHLISGEYLCATQNPHPNDRNLLNLMLIKDMRQDCYFRILNLYDNARDSVEYKTDLRIVSIKFDTQITMGVSMIEIKTRSRSVCINPSTRSEFGLNSGGDDSNKHRNSDNNMINQGKSQIFPLDLTIKRSCVDTFNGDKFTIGMQFKNENPTPIRFIEYCSRYDLDRFAKNKNIKNGTFIRLQSPCGYLTGKKTSAHSELSLDTHNNDEYQYNYINTIFQVIDSKQNYDHENNYEDLPRGEEVYSTSKRIQYVQDTSNYYLKHYRTDTNVCNPEAGLIEQKYQNDYMTFEDDNTSPNSLNNSIVEESDDDEDEDDEEEEMPLIEFVSLIQDEEYQSINKSSSVSIKVKYGKNPKKRYLMDRYYPQQNLDEDMKNINNDFFAGDTNETDKIIKPVIKLLQKNIILDQNNGIQFKLIPIPENQMIEIMEIEAYSNSLKKYLRIFEKSRLFNYFNVENLDVQTSIMLSHTIQFLTFFKKVNNRYHNDNNVMLNHNTVNTDIQDHDIGMNSSNTATTTTTHHPGNNSNINGSTIIGSIHHHHYNYQQINLSDLSANNYKQIICREFKIIDLLSMIFYYILVDEWFTKMIMQWNDNDRFRHSGSSSFGADDNKKKTKIITPLSAQRNKKQKIGYKNLQKMLEYMIKALIIIIRDNQLNKLYCSQFLKIFLNCFFTPRGIFIDADDKMKQEIKYSIIDITTEILENEGSIYSNQLQAFELRLFDLLEINHNDEFDQINLIFLNFVFKLKSSVIQNTIVRNFINNHLDNDERRKLLLPKFKSRDYLPSTPPTPTSSTLDLEKCFLHSASSVISPTNASGHLKEEIVETQGTIYAVIRRHDNGEELEVNLNEDNPKARYVIGMLEILNSLASQESLKFSQIIIKHYPHESCLKILENKKLLSELKDEISKLLKNVHDNYTQLPIKEIPNEIQLILMDHGKFVKKTEQIIKKAKEMLISNAERDLLDQRKLYHLYRADHYVSHSKSKKNSPVVDIKNIVIKLEEQFENQSYKIHLMQNILMDSKILDPEKVLMIHNNIVKLLKIIAEDQDDSSSNSELHAYKDNADAIISIMELVDDHVIRLSLMETFCDIRHKLLHDQDSIKTNLTPIETRPSFASLKDNRRDPQASLQNMEKEVMQRFSEAFCEEWRNKKKLYGFVKENHVCNEGIGANPNEEVFLEEQVINYLWKLIERHNPKLASLAIKALQKKAKFESRVLNELDRWTIISSEKEAEKMANIIESLLKCHQISRKLRIIEEFNLDKIDNKVEMISKVVLESLENIITAIYDYNQHIGKTIEGDKDQKRLFLSRLKESKENFILDKPFVYREKCIKIEFQKVMANLNAHDILIALIPEFYYATNFKNSDPEFILIYRYIAIILIIFVKDNKHNQLLLANNKNLITIFSDKTLIESNTDTVSLFFELCHGNKKLLKLELPHINQIVQKYFLQQQNLLETDDNEEEQEQTFVRTKSLKRSLSKNRTLLFNSDFTLNSKVKNSKRVITRIRSRTEGLDLNSNSIGLQRRSSKPHLSNMSNQEDINNNSVIQQESSNTIRDLASIADTTATSLNDSDDSNAPKSVIPFILNAHLRKNPGDSAKATKNEVIYKVNPYKNISKIRNLSLIFSSMIAKECYDIDNMMLEKLHQLDEFLVSGDLFSLNTILSGKPILTTGEVQNTLFSILKLKPENTSNSGCGNAASTQEKKIWYRYELPIKYTLVKELFSAELAYLDTNDKTRIMFMQNKRQSRDFLSYLSNKNIEYHFEIKGLILRFMDQLFYKKFKKPNVFESIDDFDKFSSHLFVDIIGYIMYQSNKKQANNCNGSSGNSGLRGDNFNDNTNDKNDDNSIGCNISFIDNDCFLFEYPKVKRGIQNYQKLFKSNNNYNILSKATFLEYQHDVYFIDSWKKYIFCNITDIFNNILTYDSGYMLINKQKHHEKASKFHTCFDVWLHLIKNLLEVEVDRTYTVKLLDVIKKITLIPDFSAYKDILTIFKNQVQQDLTKKNKLNNSVLVKQYSFLLNTLVTDIFTKLDLRNILNSHIKEGRKNSQTFREKNLRILAHSLIENEFSIKRMVKFIGQENNKECCVKDIIFILRLLRKIIEIQNPRVIDYNKPIYEWNDLSSTDFERIVIIQDTLKRYSLVKSLYNLFLNYSQHQKIFKETLELSISLLYGGNKDIQDLYYKEFVNDTENSIIQYIAVLVDNIFANIFTNETNRNKILYFKSQNFIYEYFESKQSIDNLSICTGYKNEVGNKFEESLADKEKEGIKANQEYILLMIILKFMQCLCENHHIAFQDFLTNQIFDGKYHVQSFNFTAYFRTIYQKYLKVLNIYNIDIGIKLVDLLIEILQGESKEIANIMLKKTLVSDICQTLTCYDNDLDLLPRGFKFDKYNEKLQHLKTKCIILLKTLLERSSTIVTDNANLNKYYDIDCIVSFMVSSFQKYTNKKGSLPDKSNVEIKEYFSEPYLLNGITCYIILKYLCSNTEEFYSKMTETLEKLDLASQERIQMDYMIFKFCETYVGSIEIHKKKTNQIVRIYFPILVVFDYLTLEMRNNFEENVDRSNTQTKAEEFMQAVDILTTQIFLEYNSRNRFLGLNMNIIYKWLRISTNFIGLLANIINMITLTYFFDQEADVEFVTQNSDASQAVAILGIVNTGLSLILLAIWGSSKMDKILKSRWVKYVDENLKNLGTLPPMTELYLMNNKEDVVPPKEICDIILKVVEPYSEEWEIARSQSPCLYYYISLKFLMFCGSFIWHVLYFLICAGSAFHPIICAFQLWDIVVRSDTISRLATAISNNANQFFWTVVLLLTTIYIYSLIGLFYLNKEFVDDGMRLCLDEYSCFLANLNYGLRSGGGIAELLSKPVYDSENREIYLIRVIFDLSFFIVVIILMMNLIFGMIIDSFGELRDEKTKNEDDMNNVCFVCGISRNEIERYFDFQHHIQHEHNIWYYLAYLIYVQQKNQAAPTELTDIESYVLDRFSKKDHAWLPIGRSLSLEIIFEQGEKQKKSEIDILKEDITQLISSIIRDNKLVTDELKEVKNILANNQLLRKCTTKFGSQEKFR